MLLIALEVGPVLGYITVLFVFVCTLVCESKEYIIVYISIAVKPMMEEKSMGTSN